MECYCLVFDTKTSKYLKIEKDKKYFWGSFLEATHFNEDEIKDIQKRQQFKKSCKVIKLNEENEISTPFESYLKSLDDLKLKQTNLEKQLKVCEHTLLDISHHLELTPNISNKMRAEISQFQTKVLKKRRMIKDNLARIECIFSHCAIEYCTMEEIDTQLNFKDRTYHKRALPILFESNQWIKYETWEQEILKL